MRHGSRDRLGPSHGGEEVRLGAVLRPRRLHHFGRGHGPRRHPRSRSTLTSRCSARKSKPTAGPSRSSSGMQSWQSSARPRSHEDDPERAVRAGLRILDAIQELNDDPRTDLAVRVGINTGEVLVALGARPELGEGIVTGRRREHRRSPSNRSARRRHRGRRDDLSDPRATCSTTSRSRRSTAKGKAEPVAAWRRSRLGHGSGQMHTSSRCRPRWA